ncbi:MAG TPA: zf-HC2 domain-containing protein [Pyrinomonadaceae bacterium]
MNHDSDKEMNVLLRRHARRGASGLADASAKPESPHMDADELSAYAEGALPDASRSRYMLHLADCDSCRKIVTELVLSSAVEAEEPGTVAQTLETPSRSWREWFAALLSPPVLRYAAPVLALVAFASIIFVVVTRNREIPSLVSRKDAETAEQAPNRDAKQSEPPASAGTSNSASANQPAPVSAGTGNAAPEAAGPASQAPRETGTTTTSTQPDGLSASDTRRGADAPANAPAPATVQESEVKQTQPPAQAAAPADKSVEAGKERDNSGFINQNRRESNDATFGGAQAGAASGTGRRSQSREPENSSAGLAATTDSTNEERQKKEAARRAPATVVGRARRDTAGADEDSSPTRTVAGKRFRQQNGVWVDTSYNSSRSATRVRRGSEQYRALVADAPIIGTVSSSLGGDVIVVVGGRAYHIY